MLPRCRCTWAYRPGISAGSPVSRRRLLAVHIEGAAEDMELVGDIVVPAAAAACRYLAVLAGGRDWEHRPSEEGRTC